MAQGSPDLSVAAGWHLEMRASGRMKIPKPRRRAASDKDQEAMGESLLGCCKTLPCLDIAVCVFDSGGAGRAILDFCT